MAGGLVQGVGRRSFLFSLLGQSGPWAMENLRRAPAVYAASEQQEDGVRGLFFESEPYRGKVTRVFAWYGVPAERRGKLPAMVLVHGGGGTAFAEWVRIWNRRGFAAIAMDTSGAVPLPRGKAHPLNVPRRRHEFAGPNGWGGFDQVDEPLKDQWSYHAVAAVIRAHSLLRSFPEVDERRVGLTGISYGGYLSSIAGSLDRRFRFAAPVYGCGFADGEESAWLPALEKMGSARRERWLAQWDAARYLPEARIPFLWVSGTNDRYYPLPGLQRSYRLPRGPRYLSIMPGMKHSHPDGVKPEVIAAFAQSPEGLIQVQGSGERGEKVWAQFKGRCSSAVLHYTEDAGPWLSRVWRAVPAEVRGRRVEGQLPAKTVAYFFNLSDERGITVSSEHRVR